MKILKPVRKVGGMDGGGVGGEGEVIKVDVVRDVVKMEGKEGGTSCSEEQAKGQVGASKNVGGGAFHWMK
jgi:hypothetical protein